jgi:prepilin peptidase CpaA
MANIFSGMEFLILIILALMLLPAAVTDLKSQRIPNKITFPALIIGIIFNTWFHGFDGLFYSLQGMGIGLAIFLVPYFIGKMGAGDAKLMAAVGAFLGPKGIFIAFIYIAIAGGIYSLLLILFRRKQFEGFFREQYVNALVFSVTKKLDLGNNQVQGRPRLCYGLAIAVGTWLYIGLELFGTGQLVPL